MRTAALLLAALLAVPAAARTPASAEPALPTGKDIQDRPYPKLTWTRFPGKDVTAPLGWDEIVQGQLGSCFFLATLAAVARTQPDALDARIRPEKGGGYSVMLFDRRGRRASVAVDDRFPATADGKAFFGRGRNAGDIRAALFEKAFAKLRGGYSAIDGGDSTDAFQALTGRRAHDYFPAKLSADASWTVLTRALAGRRPVTAATREDKELTRLSGRPDPEGVIDDHVYAVLDALEDGGKRVVRLYTPLSPGDAGYDESGPRVLELGWDSFRKYFDTLTVGA